jgi:apolipoprotein N-acyltransferase
MLALSGFAWLLDGAATRRRAFLDGWAFGAGFFGAGLYWIANALLVDAAAFGWIVPFALLAIALGFGLFAALAALAAAFWPAGRARILAFAAAWLVLEWLRSWILTGFPWNLLGSALSFAPELLQTAAWGGPWVLSALILAVALLPSLAVGSVPRRRLRAMAGGVLAGIVLLAVLFGLGAWRMSVFPTTYAQVTNLRLVQPAIDQRDKWRSILRDSHFATHIALSVSQSAVAPDLVIWPEAAIPWQLLADPARREAAAAVLQGNGLLLAGGVRFERDAAGVALPYNSLVALGPGGAPIAFYDKRHLVPFGEYVPLRGLLPIDKLTPGAVDFVSGTGPEVLALGKIPPFRALVCYEVIFPAEIQGSGPRPEWLLNVTNDGWYGVSTGPYQHFQAARLRAVEQGLPLVRAANNGISGLIDPVGRVLARLPLDAVGVLDAALPAPLPGPTLYARWGDWTLLGILLPLFVQLAWQLRCLRRVDDR